jgi:cholera toxin transcriptional activator
MASQNNSRIARFGVFELNLGTGELRKGGVKLRLQEQPFQVLSVLVERAGDVVTREELRNKLWPSDTFVDFDHSLNTAVNKLREVLGDSATNPRFVETLARRGYRFIAPLHAAVPDEPRAKVTNAEPVAQGAVTAPSASVLHPQLDVPVPDREITRGLFALIQVMYLIFYVSALFHLHGIQTIADSFLAERAAFGLLATVMVTAGVGIPLRLYLLSAAGYDYQKLGDKFGLIFPPILALDTLWAVAPFLLTQKIGLGAAFAASAALLYLPFSERTLVRMAYVGPGLR